MDTLAGAAVLGIGGLAVLIGVGLALVAPVKLLWLAVVYVVFFPKLSLLAIPGSHISLRGEDVLIALLSVRVIVDLLRGAYSRLSASPRRIVGWYMMLVPIGLVGLVAGLIMGTVESPQIGLLYLFRKVEYFALFIAALFILRDDPGSHLNTAERLLKFSVIFHFVFSVFQTLGILGGFRRGAGYAPLPDGRVISTFSGAYEIGGYLVLIAPFFLWMLFRGRKALPALFYLSLISATVVMTQSRSSIIALLVILVGMAALTIPRYGFAIVSAGLLAGTAVLLAAPDVLSGGRFETLDPREMAAEIARSWNARSYEILQDYGYVVSGLSEDLSFSIRVGRWFNLIDGQMRFNPVFGLGPSAGGEAVDGNFVRLLVEFGILGLIVWIGVLVAISKALRESPPSAFRSMLAWGGVSLIVQALFIDVFEASKIAEFYWFMLGLWLMASQSARTLTGSESRAFAVSSSRPALSEAAVDQHALRATASAARSRTEETSRDSRQA